MSRESRAARLRAKADRLDPDGALVPLSLPRGGQYHATWESCCDVHYFNTTGIGAPVTSTVSPMRRRSLPPTITGTRYPRHTSNQEAQ